MLKRLLLLAVLVTACWSVSTAVFAEDKDDSNGDTAVVKLDSCSAIKPVAKDHMPNWAYERFDALSLEDCEKFFGLGYTESELSELLSGALYIEDTDNWPEPVDNSKALKTFLAPNLNLTRGSSEHIGNTNMHHVYGADGFTLHNQSDPFWMLHRWNHAGKEPNHIRVSVELEHHYQHYHDWWDYRMYHDSPVYNEPWWHYYRRLNHSYEERNSDADGYQTFKMKVRYQHRKCHEDGWICWRPWTTYRESSNCNVAAHVHHYGECYDD